MESIQQRIKEQFSQVSYHRELSDALIAAHRLSSQWRNAVYYVLEGRDGRFTVLWKERGHVLRFHSDDESLVARVQANAADSGDPSRIYPADLTDDHVRQLEERRGDPGWNAALHILTFPPIAEKSGIWSNVDPVHGIDFAQMLEETGYMSGGERRLVRIAASCYGTSHLVQLQEVVSGLCDEWMDRALEAIRMSGR